MHTAAGTLSINNAFKLKSSAISIMKSRSVWGFLVRHCHFNVSVLHTRSKE